MRSRSLSCSTEFGRVKGSRPGGAAVNVRLRLRGQNSGLGRRPRLLRNRKVVPMTRATLPSRPSRILLAGGACLLVLGGAAPAAFAWPFGPKPVQVEAPPPLPPPPPPPPAVGLSDRALADASAFRAYVKHAETISAAFTDGAGV